MKARPLPTACANLVCSNRPGEGEFVLVTYDLMRYPNDATRGLPAVVEIMVCGPCAEALGRAS